jgi:hypothetical protein
MLDRSNQSKSLNKLHGTPFTNGLSGLDTALLGLIAPLDTSKALF